MGYSRIGNKIKRQKERRLHAEWITATILTSTDHRDDPITANFRCQTNNQYDFRKFIAMCLYKGVLRWGDTLIMDNARIHKAKNTFTGIQHGLARRGISILFMPTYSPELNPCELVFAQVKKFIRETWIRSNGSFRVSIFEGFLKVQRSNLEKF